MMVHVRVFTVLLCLSAAFSADYFQCHLDLCKRGEQYCVEESKRCYHCADVAHLCNTTELSRDCDSHCYRVQLQKVVELDANKKKELADRQAELQHKQEKNADLRHRVIQLESNISTLTTVNEDLNAEVIKNENLQTKYKEVVKQLKQSDINFFIACMVGGVLGVIVVLLSGTLCLYCRDKHLSNSIGIAQAGEMKEERPSDLVPLMDICTNHPAVSPGLTINGDVTVSRLEVQSPDNSTNNDISDTPPPVYQSRSEARKDSIDITVTDKNDINKMDNERTPSVLKNIQPTDSLSNDKDPAELLSEILIVEDTNPK